MSKAELAKKLMNEHFLDPMIEDSEIVGLNMLYGIHKKHNLDHFSICAEHDIIYAGSDDLLEVMTERDMIAVFKTGWCYDEDYCSFSTFV